MKKQFDQEEEQFTASQHIVDLSRQPVEKPGNFLYSKIIGHKFADDKEASIKEKALNHAKTSIDRSASHDDPGAALMPGEQAKFKSGFKMPEIQDLALVSIAVILYRALFGICYCIGSVLVKVLHFFIRASGSAVFRMKNSSRPAEFSRAGRGIINVPRINLAGSKAGSSARLGETAGRRMRAAPVLQLSRREKKAGRKHKADYKKLFASIKSFEFGLLIPRPDFESFKKAMVFLILAAILLLPFKAITFFKNFDAGSLKGRVLGASESGISNLITASKELSDLNFSGSEQYFTQAGKDFLSAQEKIADINAFLFMIAGLLPDPNLQLAAHSREILRSAEIASTIGNLASRTLDDVFAGTSSRLQAGEDTGKFTLGEKILDIENLQGRIIPLLEELRQNVRSIPAAAVPGEYRQNFILLNDNLDEYIAMIKDLHEATEFIAEAIGAEKPKRYLFIFQNNAEMRGSGGFIGSYAIVDLAKGEVKSIEAPGGGSYDTEAGMRETIISPEPLRLLKPRWFFWDANWWPDWPFTAEKLKAFLEKSDGPSVDGVIALTPAVIERLLGIIGPVELPDYGITLDNDNFWITVQRLAEQKQDVTSTPKQIIGDLMDKLIKELPGRVNKDNFVDLVKMLGQSLDEKNAMFYFSDPALQQEIRDSGWDHSIRDTFRDYLMVTDTNIGGGKSDRAIKEDIYHQVEVQSDGSIIDSLRIIRSHNAAKGDEFTGVRNVDWMRIYVPQGSELLEAAGFEPVDPALFKEPEEGWKEDPDILKAEIASREHIGSKTKVYEEFGKTVFANWSQLDPGHSATIYLKYKLPFKFVKTARSDWLDKVQEYLNPSQKELLPFSLLVQKQPGSQNSSLFSSLTAPAGYKLVWNYPECLAGNPRGWQNATALSEDTLYAVIFEDPSAANN